MSFRENYKWQENFIPTIKKIVGPFLLEIATFEQDTRENTDLIVLSASGLRIAARTRRPGYFVEYPYQFTIRSRVRSGLSTEIDKIIDGWGDWFFYGQAVTEEGVEINQWWLIDLKMFRAALIRNALRRKLLFGEKPNGDGTWFFWFDLRSFPRTHPILIASSHPLDDPIHETILQARLI